MVDLKWAALLSLVAALPAAAQPVSVGVTGGLLPLDPLTSGPSASHSESGRYTIGPSIEFRLPAGFSVGTEALFKRLGNSFSVTNPPATPFLTSYQIRVNALEFPFLLKKRFPVRAGLEPFAEGGYALRKAWITSGFFDVTKPDGSVIRTDLTGADTGLGHGFVLGGGLDWKKGRFRLGPEFRFTRYNGQFPFERRNQAEVLFTFRF